MRLTILFFLFMISSMGFSQDRFTSKSFSTRSEVIATHGMAATSQPLATQVALDILKQGGTAVDAAIAANAMLGLVEPTGCGIGGDLFAIVWDAKSQKLHGLNASGRSPKGLDISYFQRNGMDQIPSRGPLAVSVPGCVDGWFELHDRFGKLPMEVILAPTISYAREGFPMTEVISFEMGYDAPYVKDLPYFAQTYLPNGRPPQKGEIFKNPKLAYTMELIADGGRKAFYKGEIAKKIASHMEEHGGFITRDDLTSHQSEWVEPVSVNYRGYDVWELHHTEQGIAVLQMLNILEQYDLKSMGFGSAEYIHTFVEAKKIAYEDRAKFYADPSFNQIPVDKLISKNYSVERA
ncbi:MAG: gamma-glutamyltransferase, partial [Bacteroidetes bacterium]|nr:gamma-glutamyltransferase [Bacteroidota bacterium]